MILTSEKENTNDIFKLVAEANKEYREALDLLNETVDFNETVDNLKRDINTPLSFVLR